MFNTETEHNNILGKVVYEALYQVRVAQLLAVIKIYHCHQITSSNQQYLSHRSDYISSKN